MSLKVDKKRSFIALFSNTQLFDMLDVYQTVFVLGLILIFFGFYLFITNFYNLITSLIAVELIILAINTLFVELYWLYSDPSVLVVILCILVVSAVETAIGAGVLIVAFAVRKTVSFNDMSIVRF